MRNFVITTTLATLMAGTAFAGTVGGEVELVVKENTAGDWAGSMGVDLDVQSAEGGVNLGFTAEEGSAIELDTWTVGTAMYGVGVKVGNDNDVFVGAEGEQTLASPTMTESVQVNLGDAAVAVGLTDWNSDITDLSNIQASYKLGLEVAEVTAAVDYNLDTENTLLGAEVALGKLGVAEVGKTITYDVDGENLAGEVTATAYGVTAYVNGDQDELLQNVGGEYTHGLGGADLTVSGAYNLDTEEFTPKVAVSFAF